MKRPSHRECAALVAGCAAFCLLAVLNCGGYKYGVGDQAFYIPAVVQHLDTSLFPRDRVLLHVQDQFIAYDDLAAAVVKATGVSLPVVFAVAYLGGTALLFGAVVAIGHTMFRSWWTTAVLAALLTLRHRITETGANTLEAYFHPRMLAWALGLWAVASYLRGRRALALSFLGAALLTHPTSAVWFGIWVLAAMVVSERTWRAPLAVLVAASGLAALWMVTIGPLQGHLARMDPRWASVLAGKDYIFPFDWTSRFWLINLGYCAIIGAVFRFRQRQGTIVAREAGLVAGAFALLCVFLVSVPFMREWIALALQLQTSRIFWMLDLMATFYLAWLLIEAVPRNLQRPIALAVVAFSVSRGLYVTFAEHNAANVVAIHLPSDDWTDAMQWLSRTPPETHVLADPGHAWKFGTSVRVSAQRDVYLEEVKDTALALYSRDVAMRVLQRIQDAPDFGTLTAERARTLASQYDLNYLVFDRDIGLPMAYRNKQFRIYALAARPSPLPVHPGQ